jgi:hypothetical protein
MKKFDYEQLDPETLDNKTLSEVLKALECDISWAENSLTRISRFSVAEIEETSENLKKLKGLRKKFVKK